MDNVTVEREPVLRLAPKPDHRCEVLESISARESFALVVLEPLVSDADHSARSDHDSLDLHARDAHEQPRALPPEPRVQMERVARLVPDRADRVSLLTRENERHEPLLKSVETHRRLLQIVPSPAIAAASVATTRRSQSPRIWMQVASRPSMRTSSKWKTLGEGESRTVTTSCCCCFPC